MRKASFQRETTETQISVSVTVDGEGKHNIDVGIGFLTHMLELFARHALFDITISAHGDLQVDSHHLVEDLGICLGSCLARAMGDKACIKRYASIHLPMDETLVRMVVDISGRPVLVYNCEMAYPRAGEFDTRLIRDFLHAFCVHAGVTMHVDLLRGDDPHHCAEAVFKALGRCLRQALSLDEREPGIPSSKGVL